MSQQPLHLVALPNLSTATDEEIAEFAASVWEKFSTISPSVSLGRRRDQISIWDVINTEEIHPEEREQMSKSMIVAATPKPLSKMTDDDVRAWAKQVHEQLVKLDAQRSLSSSSPPD